MKLRRFLLRALGVLSVGLVALVAIAWWRSTNDCGAGPWPAPRNPMRAYIACDYGPPSVLALRHVEKPTPGPGEVLVRVRAVSINPVDWHSLRGTPYVMRLDSGLRKPRSIRTGVDYAGVVEAVGSGVTTFAPGDEVFGGRNGALAEYIVARADRAIVGKPPNVSFEQAAAVPVAGMTALQGLRDVGALQRGERVLINGASGGVGTFAVQIARHYGAHVTGVCSSRNVALVSSLGAAHVIDYTRTNFTDGAEKYDLVLDNVGNQPLRACRRVLTERGRYVLVGGGGPNDHRILGPLGRVAAMYALSPFIDQSMRMFIANLDRRDLGVLRDMLASGAISPVLDRRYRFAEAVAALEYLETGRARGKVVITVD